MISVSSILTIKLNFQVYLSESKVYFAFIFFRDHSMWFYQMVKVNPKMWSQPLEYLHWMGSSLPLGLVGSLVGPNARVRLPEPTPWLCDPSGAAKASILPLLLKDTFTGYRILGSLFFCLSASYCSILLWSVLFLMKSQTLFLPLFHYTQGQKFFL